MFQNLRTRRRFQGALVKSIENPINPSFHLYKIRSSRKNYKYVTSLCLDDLENLFIKCEIFKCEKRRKRWMQKERKSFDPYNTFVVFKNTRRSNKRRTYSPFPLTKATFKRYATNVFSQVGTRLKYPKHFVSGKTKYFIVI